MNEITSAVLLGKDELLYLIRAQPEHGKYAAQIYEILGQGGPFERDALRSLIRKNIISFAGGMPVTVRLYDFLAKNICTAEKCVVLCQTERQRLIFVLRMFYILLEEHELNKDAVRLAAFRDSGSLTEAVKDAWDRCPALKLRIYPEQNETICALSEFSGVLNLNGEQVNRR